MFVVQPGWQYFHKKFKISSGTYNACYSRAVRKHKKLNPTKTTIPKSLIGDEIVKHMAASKDTRSEKFSKGEAVGYEKLKEKLSQQKVVVESPEAPTDAHSPQAAVLEHPPTHSLRPASAEKQPVVNTRKNAVEKVLPLKEAAKVVPLKEAAKVASTEKVVPLKEAAKVASTERVLPLKEAAKVASTENVVPLKEAAKVESTEKVKFQCGVCRKDFQYPKALQTHMSAHTEKSFQCPNCPKTYNSRRSLMKHLKKEIIECHCGEKFTSQVGLIKHQKNVHLLASCEKCPFEGTVASVAVHMHNNHRPRPEKRKGQQFPCKACPIVYSDQTTLRRHVQLVHPQEENRDRVQVADKHPDQEKEGSQVLEEVAAGPPAPPQSDVAAGPQAREEVAADATHSTAGLSRPLHATFPHSLAMYPPFAYPVPNQHPYFYPPVQIGAFGGALSDSAAGQVGQGTNALRLGDKCDYEKVG